MSKAPDQKLNDENSQRMTFVISAVKVLIFYVFL